MGWFQNKCFFGLATNVQRKLIQETDPDGADMYLIIGVALAHACYPKATAKNETLHFLLDAVKELALTCNSTKNSQNIVNEWLYKDVGSCNSCCVHVLDVTPEELVIKFGDHMETKIGVPGKGSSLISPPEEPLPDEPPSEEPPSWG